MNTWHKHDLWRVTKFTYSPTKIKKQNIGFQSSGAADTYINSPLRSISDSSLGSFWPALSSSPLTVWASQSRNYFGLRMRKALGHHKHWLIIIIIIIKKINRQAGIGLDWYQCEALWVSMRECVETEKCSGVNNVWRWSHATDDDHESSSVANVTQCVSHSGCTGMVSS